MYEDEFVMGEDIACAVCNKLFYTYGQQGSPLCMCCVSLEDNEIREEEMLYQSAMLTN